MIISIKTFQETEVVVIVSGATDRTVPMVLVVCNKNIMTHIKMSLQEPRK